MRDREQRVTDLFVALSDTMVQDYDVVDFLYTLVEGCVEILAVEAVGVMLEAGPGRLAVTAATSTDVGALEAFELQEHTGPGYAAFSDRQALLVEDLAGAQGRWPTFVPRALELGLRSGFAFPLRLRDDAIGALNLFRTTPGSLSEADRRLAQSLADVATIGILQERAVRDAELRATQLQGALDSRVVIEQAKGILAERTGESPAVAFQRIRRYSQNHNERLRAACQRVVDGELDLS